MEMIRNRYQRLHHVMGPQVELLQQDIEARVTLRSYYADGFKDWHIVSGLHNVCLNWHWQRVGWTMEQMNDPARVEQVEEFIRVAPEPASRFYDQTLLKRAMQTHETTCLLSWGFDFRRRHFPGETVRSFLRDRMKHFDLDLPHPPLFGKPVGEWPSFED